MTPRPTGSPAGERPLSTDLSDPDSVPYFLWDEPMTVAELRHRLARASRPERTRLLAKILREARDTEVWAFTTPQEVQRRWEELGPPPGPPPRLLGVPPEPVETPWPPRPVAPSNRCSG